jgi:hypothetical protein
MDFTLPSATLLFFDVLEAHADALAFHATPLASLIDGLSLPRCHAPRDAATSQRAMPRHVTTHPPVHHPEGRPSNPNPQKLAFVDTT